MSQSAMSLEAVAGEGLTREALYQRELNTPSHSHQTLPSSHSNHFDINSTEIHRERSKTEVLFIKWHGTNSEHDQMSGPTMASIVPANLPSRNKIMGKFKEISRGIVKKQAQGRLRNHLYDAMPIFRLPRQREGFIPHRDLADLLTMKRIEEELVRCNKSRFSTKKNDMGAQATKQDDIKAQAHKILGAAPSESTGVSKETLVGDSCGGEAPADGQPYKKIFAILVLMGKASKIKAFFRAGVSDADLPLICVKTKHSAVSWELRSEKNKDVSTGCLESRTKFTLAKFVEYQWSVLAPCFRSGQTKRVPHQSFRKNEVLPFISWLKLPVEGGYGQVYKAKIHSDHYSFKSVTVPIQAVAVKRLNSRRACDFEREVNILRRFSDDRHPNLISLLATYEQHGEFNLIFPWAECDLHQYWRQVNPSRSPEEHQHNLTWLAEQCRGIAYGLSFVHRYSTESFQSLLHQSSFPLTSFDKVQTPDNKEVCRLFGRHGDIKPENILWFPGPGSSTTRANGTLKITDFGIAEFSTKPAVDRKRRGGTPNSPTYCAPEIDLPDQVSDSLISPSYDVWALGCVYLEFITWWLGTGIYVDKFASRRLSPDSFHFSNSKVRLSSDKFFTIDIVNPKTRECKARVKDEVSQFIEELRGHSSCNEFLREFIDLIQQRMVIVEPPSQQSTGCRRHSSRHVAKALEGMIGKHQLVGQSSNVVLVL